MVWSENECVRSTIFLGAVWPKARPADKKTIKRDFLFLIRLPHNCPPTILRTTDPRPQRSHTRFLRPRVFVVKAGYAAFTAKTQRREGSLRRFLVAARQRQDILFHHGDTKRTEISQRHRGSPCTSVYSVSPW